MYIFIYIGFKQQNSDKIQRYNLTLMLSGGQAWLYDKGLIIDILNYNIPVHELINILFMVKTNRALTINSMYICNK